MTHIEDLVLDGGVKGARQAINALQSMRDMLAGNAKKKTKVSTCEYSVRVVLHLA